MLLIKLNNTSEQSVPKTVPYRSLILQNFTLSYIRDGNHITLMTFYDICFAKKLQCDAMQIQTMDAIFLSEIFSM